MKKLIILLLFLCIGCSYSDKIHTIIEEDDNTVIGINYPNTEFNKLNELIKIDVDNIYTQFKGNFYNLNMIQKAELNIDYNYTEFEDYISILLNITITNPNNDKTSDIIKTYFFDKQNNTLLNIKEVLSKPDLSFIQADLMKENVNIHYLKNYIDQLQFFIDEYNTHIYFTINDETIMHTYSNNNLIFNYPLKKISPTKEVTSFYIENKVYDINKKYVAITFDDGPSIYTKEIINTLQKYGVNATFFVLGNKVEVYQDLLKDSLTKGNVIGNHSYNHKWLIKLDETHVQAQIFKTNELIQTYTGYTPTLFRPTYGSINKEMRSYINMDIILWTVDTMDWKYKNVSKIVSRATSNLKDGDIILMHDIYKRSATALEKIIEEIKKQGFEIVTVLDLQQIQRLRKYG